MECYCTRFGFVPIAANVKGSRSPVMSVGVNNEAVVFYL